MTNHRQKQDEEGSQSRQRTKSTREQSVNQSSKRNGEKREKRSQDGPRRDQDGPRRGQDGPRRGQNGPRRDQDGQRRGQDGPRRGQDGPRRGQDGPRRDQDGQRRGQDGPRRDQDGPRRGQDGPRRDQDGPRRDQDRKSNHPSHSFDHVSPARQVALDALRALFEEDAFLQPVLASLADRAELQGSDRRLAWELVLGVSRRWGTLSAVLDRQLDRGLESLPAEIQYALALGAYQLLYLDKIPSYAAVNEAVSMAKNIEPRLGGVVNRVLKVIEVEKLNGLAELPPGPRLAAELSHPEWWVKRQKQRIGLEATKALAAANNEAAPLCIRLAPHIDVFEGIAELEEEGATLTPLKWASGGFSLNHQNPFSQESHRRGDWYAQDEASQLVAQFLAPTTGSRVWDVCAAPGGKSLTLLEMIGSSGELISTDLHERKAKQLQDRLSEYPNVFVYQADASHGAPDEQLTPFDSILLDAPCSALGVIRRHPEIRWRRTERDITRAAKKQLKLLEAVALSLKVGGILVYSVCTDTTEETDGVLHTFLSAFPDFALCPPETSELWSKLLVGGVLKLSPSEHGTDGFFAARLKRIK